MKFNVGQLVKSTYARGGHEVCIIIKILPSNSKTSWNPDYPLVEYLPMHSNAKLSTAYLNPDVWEVIG